MVQPPRNGQGDNHGYEQQIADGEFHVVGLEGPSGTTFSTENKYPHWHL